MIILLVLTVAIVFGILLIAVISACMLSSMTSRREEEVSEELNRYRMRDANARGERRP